ncbi:Protein brunelleschi, partial [Frankliniella fusca]
MKRRHLSNKNYKDIKLVIEAKLRKVEKLSKKSESCSVLSHESEQFENEIECTETPPCFMSDESSLPSNLSCSSLSAAGESPSDPVSKI